MRWTLPLSIALGMLISVVTACGSAPEPGRDDDVEDTPVDDSPIDDSPAPIDDAPSAPPQPDPTTPDPTTPDPTTPDPQPDPGPPDEPGAASPAEPGGRTVDTVDLTAGDDDEVPVRVYLPNGAPLAVALFLPGFQLQTSYYAELLEHLASHGVAVVAADPPASLFSVDHVRMAAQASAALDAVFAAGAPLANEDAPVFAMGHSLGGKLSVMVAAADARVAGVFAIDPVNGSGPTGYSATRPDVVPDAVAELAMPLGFVGETVDATTDSLFGQACAPADQSFTTFYDAAQAATARFEWEIAGAGHMDFVDDTGACGFACGLCNESTADPAATRAIVRALAVAFVRRFAAADAAMEQWLVGARVPDDVSLRSTP